LNGIPHPIELLYILSYYIYHHDTNNCEKLQEDSLNMQTFRDFLLERTQTPDQVAHALLRQCMPYINGIGEVEFDTVLYRGTDAKIEDFVPRERSESGGVTSKYSGDTGQVMRNYFSRKCGINIETIIFATGDLSLAERFGNPFIIFPVGPFKFAYSKSGVRLPDILSNPKDLERANFICGVADDTSDDGLPEPRLQNAVKSHNEVLIQAKSYLPISLPYWKQNGQTILEELSFR